jgi:hypothetical protein
LRKAGREGGDDAVRVGRERGRRMMNVGEEEAG